MALQSKLLLAKRLIPLGFALAVAALVTIPTGNPSQVQSPPADEITPVNANTREVDTAQRLLPKSRWGERRVHLRLRIDR